MITSIIQAGFGNQLFQYAMAYALAKDSGQELTLDTSFFTSTLNLHTPREYQLDKLSLDAHHQIVAPKAFNKYSCLGKLTQRIPWVTKLLFPSFICENVRDCREYQDALLARCKAENNPVLYGFWQNTRYFHRYRKELCRQFVPSYAMEAQAEETLSCIEATTSVGVHIRRGDFVALGWDKKHDYYDKGMELLRARYADARFYIFTDDVAWAQERYSASSDVDVMDIRTATKDLDEFFLLSKCKHQIISESTFGWWAAYLNEYAGKTVVEPKDARGEIFENDWLKL